MKDLRSLPSVDQLINGDRLRNEIVEYGRPLTINAVRTVLENARQQYKNGIPLPDQAEIIHQIGLLLCEWTRPTLIPVINATGVVIHTNLGRSPLSIDAMADARGVSCGYSNLEYDMEKGKRGSRLTHAESLLCRLTGAEAAMVVNNNAAALMLVLSALAKRRKVVIARSQLVEIGGGFRIPDVMKQSGAKLLEVGTTNRVHLADYENALEEKPALIMRAHRSNFTISGFTSEPSLREIASVSKDAGIPLVDDLGSGTLLDTEQYGLAHEPMVQESLEDGADLVCFSGDKLLGGPQAGVIVGRKALLSKLKKHPLARAVRADKLCLSAMTGTLLHYIKDEAEDKIPIWRMIGASIEVIRERAEMWRDEIGSGEVITGESTVGGGSLPGETQKTCLLAISVSKPHQLNKKFRECNPPIIGRVEKNTVLLDPRTVLPEQDTSLIAGLKSVLL